ncbi:hypothetical protein [Nonomuraea pusilla]|uniref:Integral membrane protein n=1 Tax=Nonomuraea pusilla TaxID=46177 RepID=A0A1H7LI07_9ACTN|nr:hypothetical protein [Nonomuraea pusilla]SEK98574.1 hypothetical protein SAMN05660976_01583 [Nonomuraea pusilla]
MSTGDELKAAVAARRDLGPDFEDAVVESFLDKMGQEVDRRVDERLAAAGPSGKDRDRAARRADGQRLALAIVSLSVGTAATLPLALLVDDPPYAAIWIGIVLVNLIFNMGSHRR